MKGVSCPVYREKTMCEQMVLWFLTRCDWAFCLIHQKDRKYTFQTLTDSAFRDFFH